VEHRVATYSSVATIADIPTPLNLSKAEWTQALEWNDEPKLALGKLELPKKSALRWGPKLSHLSRPRNIAAALIMLLPLTYIGKTF
jgi:hypothetical protein